RQLLGLVAARRPGQRDRAELSMRPLIMAPDKRRRPGRTSRQRGAGLGRRGLSLLEVQVAFAVLGVGLVGMCQLAVVQLRQVRTLERRLEAEVVQSSSSGGTSTFMLPGQTYYLVPWQNPWARKVTGAAQIVNGA